LVYRKTHPNWKIDPFLSWMGIVFRHAWHSGRYGSCDEQDMMKVMAFLPIPLLILVTLIFFS
jgi:hypothetical protein